MKQNAQLLLVKKETVIGVPETLTGAMAQRISDLTVTVSHDKEARNNITGFLGAQGAITVGTSCDIDFSFELTTTGTAGVLPKYDTIMLASGHKAVVVADTSVTYSPLDIGSATMTVGYYADGLYVIIGSVRGSLSFALDANKIEKATFKGKGIVSTVSASNPYPSGVDFSALTVPIGITKANSDFMLFGSVVYMQSLTFDTGVVVEHFKYTGTERIEITDRKATLKTKVLTSDAQYVSMMQASLNGDYGIGTFVHGTKAGHTITLNMPTLQTKTSPSISFDKGLAHLDLEFDAVPMTKESDYSIVFS
jgi:hypothetical protein